MKVIILKIITRLRLLTYWLYCEYRSELEKCRFYRASVGCFQINVFIIWDYYNLIKVFYLVKLVLVACVRVDE